jgi:hypothetical protein
MAACQEGGIREVQLLLEHSADVDMADAAGVTALVTTAAHKRPKILSLLLDASATPDLRTKTGNTALMTAASSGADRCVELLLAAGARTELTNEAGETALHWAEKNGHAATQLLLQRGRDQAETIAEPTSTEAPGALGPHQVRLRTSDGSLITVDESQLDRKRPHQQQPQQPQALRFGSDRSASRRLLLAQALLRD